MLNRMARLTKRLHDTVMRWVAVDIEYFFGGLDGERLAFRAGMLEVDIEATDAAGTTITSRRTDFLIRAENLVLHGERVRPELGDVIRVWMGDGHTQTYEVMPVGTDSHYEPSDPSNSAWRTHTRMISEE